MVRHVWYAVDSCRDRAEEFEEYVRGQVSLYRDTRKPCSCWMCGNERSYMGATLQERRSADSMRQQWEAWEDEQRHYDDWDGWGGEMY